MASVHFDHVTITYPGSVQPTVDGLDLFIEDGEFLVLVGPSGCGKSTTLRALAGLEYPTDGTIRLGDEDITRMDPKDRDIAMVFQTYALYPNMTVFKNMAFPLTFTDLHKDEITARVTAAAELLDLTPYLKRKPKDLSGGQRQRVAMGRAIVRQPLVFCMDEPLSNLDAKLRVQMRTELKALQKRLGTTTVYVTHDQVEAMTMGDRVAVMKDGLLEQVAKPDELYFQPATAFVAGFIGSPAMNLLTATDATGKTVILGIRPENVRLTGADDSIDGETTVHCVVDLIEELGSSRFIHTHRKDNAAVSICARADGVAPLPTPGENVTLSFDMTAAHWFDADTGKRLTTPFPEG